MSQASSAATAPPTTQFSATTGSSTAATADPEGGRAYSDPTEMMEKRKRCNERAERMRKAYQRRLREEFGNCLSKTETQCSPVGYGSSRYGDDDSVAAVVVTASSKTSSAATATTAIGNIRPPKLPTGPIWLLRRQRSRCTYDDSLGSLESCTTDAGTPSTVGTSIDAAQSPQAAAEHRRRMQRMRRASSVSVTCDGDSINTAGTPGAAAGDSTLQLRFKSLVRRHGSSFRLAAGLLVSSRRRQSSGLSCGDASSAADISLGANSLKSVKTERKAVKVLGAMFLLFFISWASFFSMNLAMGLCPTCHFEELLYKWFLWLNLYGFFLRNFVSVIEAIIAIVVVITVSLSLNVPSLFLSGLLPTQTRLAWSSVVIEVIVVTRVVSLARLLIQHPQPNHLHRLQPSLQANLPPPPHLSAPALLRPKRRRGWRSRMVGRRRR